AFQHIYSAFATLTIYYLIFFVLIHKIIPADDIGWTMKYFHIAIITSLVFTLILHCYFVFEMGFAEGLDFGESADTIDYDLIARGFVKSFKEGGQYSMQGAHDGVTGYSIFLAINYYLFGESVLAGKLINVIFYGMSVVLASRIACLLFGAAVGKRTAFLMCCYTVFIFYSGYLLKESLIIILILTGILNIINMAIKLTYLRIIHFFLITVCIYLTRQWIVFIYVITAYCFLIYTYRVKLNLIKIFFATCIAAICLFSVNFTLIGVSPFYYLYEFNFGAMVRRGEYVYFNGIINYLIFLFSNIGYLSESIVFGLWSFWLHPFYLYLPTWDAQYGYEVIQTVEHMGSFMLWLLLPAIFSGMYQIVSREKGLSMIIFFIILISMLSLMFYVQGAIRYKYFIMPFFIMAASLGIKYIDRWYHIIKYYLLSLVLISIYGVSKWPHGSDHFQMLMIIMIIFILFVYLFYKTQFIKTVSRSLESSGT
ncbi:MAG: hypothetical protein NT178_17005, partial [Proteobacteria bacterium]|nr:hypothetical protein [Pseudomonadota bacterium]